MTVPSTPASARFDWFRRFSQRVARSVGAPWAFAAALVVVLGWAITGPIFHYSNTWQLIINTVTTIITFLLVALLQNSQTRNDQATQHKLNAIADGLADLMAHIAHGGDRDMEQDLLELRDAVGLEDRESTTHNELAKN